MPKYNETLDILVAVPDQVDDDPGPRHGRGDQALHAEIQAAWDA